MANPNRVFFYITKNNLNQLKKRNKMLKMFEKNENSAFELVKTYLPNEILEALSEYLVKNRTSESCINEIRLRSHGLSSLSIGVKNISLGISLGAQQMKEIFKRICDGAIFAHRDDVCRGFVSLNGGVRVGVCGHARYENGLIVGVSDISALVFRLPTGECSFARDLYKEWSSIGGGMLICSMAGGGKTTAIRSLAKLIGTGRDARRVVVADERCEFSPSDYTDAHVDILRGYKRALGIDIAIRTMTAEILIVDEISAKEDAMAMLSALGAGVTVIATAHAESLEGAMKREYISELVRCGMFESVCVIERRDDDFSYSLGKITRYGG